MLFHVRYNWITMHCNRIRHHRYHIDFPRVSWRLISPACWLFGQRFVKITSTKNQSSLCEEIHRLSVGLPHKMPVMRKPFHPMPSPWISWNTWWTKTSYCPTKQPDNSTRVHITPLHPLSHPICICYNILVHNVRTQPSLTLCNP